MLYCMIVYKKDKNTYSQKLGLQEALQDLIKALPSSLLL